MNTNTMKAIQFISKHASLPEATALLHDIQQQDGCLGGRIITGFAVQFFMEHHDAMPKTAIEAMGGRIVDISETLAVVMGVRQQTPTVSLTAFVLGDPANGIPSTTFDVHDLYLADTEHRRDVRLAFTNAFETLTGEHVNVMFSDELQRDRQVQP